MQIEKKLLPKLSKNLIKMEVVGSIYPTLKVSIMLLDIQMYYKEKKQKIKFYKNS
jgi:hypothetical protein